MDGLPVLAVAGKVGRAHLRGGVMDVRRLSRSVVYPGCAGAWVRFRRTAVGLRRQFDNRRCVFGWRVRGASHVSVGFLWGAVGGFP